MRLEIHYCQPYGASVQTTSFHVDDRFNRHVTLVAYRKSSPFHWQDQPTSINKDPFSRMKVLVNHHRLVLGKIGI